MRLKRYINVLILLVLVLVILKFRSQVLNMIKNPSQIRDFLLSYRQYAVFIFLVISTVRSVFLLPAGAFAVISGLTFGNFIGTLLTCVGVTLSGILAYLLSSLLGGEFVENILKDKIYRINKYIKNNGLFYMVSLRLIPIFPFDAVSYASGLLKINFKDFVLGTFLGSIPGAFIYTFLGNSLLDVGSIRFKISLLLVIISSMIPIIYKYVLKKG
ncbi:TVP38/TMEM64 family protein [Thermobrachium celere]|uniref:TVP38/TMEM64 family membrane protein n=1 Tax=Thermobrachium celere DSM 8682 TaxID=941824 RepID=R7RR82_9CLOT|nr:TVP38/TMEM64 family protein [Thermobrachium celere]CDF57813.1 Rhodanese domain protein [Thermobrachium celere DSM 8682]